VTDSLSSLCCVAVRGPTLTSFVDHGVHTAQASSAAKSFGDSRQLGRDRLRKRRAEDKVRARKTEPQVLVLVGLNVGANLDICDFCTAR
jgi:hypothetical protein